LRIFSGYPFSRNEGLYCYSWSLRQAHEFQPRVSLCGSLSDVTFAYRARRRPTVPSMQRNCTIASCLVGKRILLLRPSHSLSPGSGMRVDESPRTSTRCLVLRCAGWRRSEAVFICIARDSFRSIWLRESGFTSAFPPPCVLSIFPTPAHRHVHEGSNEVCHQQLYIRNTECNNMSVYCAYA
jgi:hypothetical protein